jgi:hypothetical protein
MTLKFKTNEVPAELEAFYKQSEDGTYVLDVEGAVEAAEVEKLKQKVKEFRENNSNLLKTNASLSAFEQVVGGLGNITPDALNSKLDTLAAQRAESMVTTMKAKYEDELKVLRDGHAKASGQLSELLLGREVQTAGVNAGVVPSAYDDVLRRAKDAFEIREGVVTYKGQSLDANGQPYTVNTWMSELSKSASHLFAPSQGIGATRNVRAQAPAQKQMTSHEKLMSGVGQLGLTSSPKRLS